MLCIYDNLNKNILSLLKKTKENYNLNNKIIAQKINPLKQQFLVGSQENLNPIGKAAKKLFNCFMKLGSQEL